MKIKYKRVLKDGRIHVLIELGPTEAFPVEALDDNAYYRLNYPHDDEILQGYQINNPKRVYWDTIAQKWSEA